MIHVTFAGNLSFMCVKKVDVLFLDDTYNFFVKNSVCDSLTLPERVVHVHTDVKFENSSDEYIRRRLRIAKLLIEMTYHVNDDVVVTDSDVQLLADVPRVTHYTTVRIPIIQRWNVGDIVNVFDQSTNFVLPYHELDALRQTLKRYVDSKLYVNYPVDVYIYESMRPRGIIRIPVIHYKFIGDKVVKLYYDGGYSVKLL